MTPPILLQWCEGMATLRRRLRQGEPLSAADQAALADLLDSMEGFVVETLTAYHRLGYRNPLTTPDMMAQDSGHDDVTGG